MMQGIKERQVPGLSPDLPSVYLASGDSRCREEIATSLARDSFVVSTFRDSASLYRAVATTRRALVVLDVVLDRESCLSIAGHLRSRVHIGIVTLAASADLETRLRSFECGADACLVKPIDSRELAAQLRVLGRRLTCAMQPVLDTAWSLEQGGWSLRDPSGNELPLTTAERQLFLKLFERPGETVSRAELLASLGSDPQFADPHRIDVLVNRIRRKALAMRMSLPVHSVRGKGYVLIVDAKATAPDMRIPMSPRLELVTSAAMD